MPKVAIAVIATGPYNALLHDFALSMSEHMMASTPRGLVVITDASVRGGRDVACTAVRGRRLATPCDVKRGKFEIIRNASGMLDGYTHVLYLDVTMRALKPMAFEDIFGTGDTLVGLAHSWLYHGLGQYKYSGKGAVAANVFSRGRESVAYKPPLAIAGATGGWLIGGLMGGPVPLFLEMCAKCSAWVEADRLRGTVPGFHDEPYWNSFASERGVRVLDPSYGWPDVNSMECGEPKMRVLYKGSGFWACRPDGLAGRVCTDDIELNCDF